MSAISVECPIENSNTNHNQFFQDVQKKFEVDNIIHSFQELVTLRKNELLQIYPDLSNGNLAAIFESSRSIAHIQSHAIISINSYWHQLEKTAIELFGNLLACWGYYERFLILDKYQALPVSLFNNLPRDEFEYKSEIVEHIENDPRYFYTLHCNTPLLLSDAIKLINIELFIIEYKWYEILSLLQLSQRGNHFLLYNKKRTILVSTSLIQNWNDRKNWLSFDPFFQGKQWISCHPLDAGKYLYETGIFNKNIISEQNCENETSFSNYLDDYDAICEVLRLTVSGPKSFRYFLLYLCQKHLMKQLVDYGKLLSFTIIEQPVMLNLYKKLSSTCYLSRCYNYINGSNNATYKGFWFTQKLRDELSNIDWKKYKSLIIQKSRINFV
ncbi:acyl-homoserine-lactone synthase [Celerinatantimonas diazotrophica]|uniref:acyl-homoserine-lactone synthase n=1 Tax=Celerinatantimonas diazotrophica TaxID=412034 RepID=A0A4V2PPR5_9GAMM|nr:acyl-homoserine-lactone synthase [Celerinatantimonas diazotrophica]TCK51981.1 acyl homoserine lactone synthase [Celerinatantimonas diazotrophica]